MPAGLTTPQKSVLMRAYHNGGTASNVPVVRGEALQRRGYGTYKYGLRMFIANEAGLRYARTGKQLED